MFPTGWGNYNAEVITFSSAGRDRALLRLPHLSTYKLFSRPQCAAALQRIAEALEPFLRERE